MNSGQRAAPTEVVASRLHWAIGFHQPPIYYIAKWTAEQAPSPNPQLPARFREKHPKLEGKLEDKGTLSYYSNPFVGTRQLNGLLRTLLLAVEADGGGASED